MSRLTWATLLLLSLSAGGCRPGAAPPAPGPPPVPPPDRARVETPGLHNVYRLTDRVYSGSSPDGDAGFRSLRRLGVRTVISVDGARPDVAGARKHGLRYIHIPIGYDGVPERQGLRLARAVRDLPGPVYVHCHHGKHRGPAAAAVVRLCLDGKCAVETALAEMRRAGTDPRYTGLFGSVQALRRPTAGDLDRVPADFPEVAEVAALAQVMVGVDERWAHLERVRAAGWKVPPDHPDIGPAHEVLQLLEQYREAARLPEVKGRPEEFRRWLADAEAGAGELERALRNGKEEGAVDGTAAEQAFRGVGAACARCHARYRDVSQAP